MKIGIIGSGQIGGTLTRRLSALGHKVYVANSRGPEAVKVSVTACHPPGSVREAGRSGELVVVTIPEKNISNLRPTFAACPRMSSWWIPALLSPLRDGRIDGIEAAWLRAAGGAEARPACREGFQQYLCRASAEARQAGRGRGADRLPVAGDDGAAKAVAAAHRRAGSRRC